VKAVQAYGLDNDFSEIGHAEHRDQRLPDLQRPHTSIRGTRSLHRQLRATPAPVTQVTTIPTMRCTSRIAKEVSMNILRNASLFALLTLVVGVVPLVMAVVYLVRPTERNLALMRPLSLAGLFAATAGGVLGLLNVLIYVSNHEMTAANTYRGATTGAAESLIPMFVGFASLTVAWLLVAVGMGWQRDRL
jgi:hypothetical protein